MQGSTDLQRESNKSGATESAAVDGDASAGWFHPETTKSDPSGNGLPQLPLRGGVGGPSCSSNDHQELQDESGAQSDDSKLPHTAAAAGSRVLS